MSIARVITTKDGAKPLVATLNCPSCGHHEGIYNPADVRLRKVGRLKRGLGIGRMDCPNAGKHGHVLTRTPMHLSMEMSRSELAAYPH